MKIKRTELEKGNKSIPDWLRAMGWWPFDY